VPAIASVAASSLSGARGRGSGCCSSGSGAALKTGARDCTEMTGGTISTVFSTGATISTVFGYVTGAGALSAAGVGSSVISSGTIPESRGSAGAGGAAAVSRSVCLIASSFPGSTARSCPDQRSASSPAPSSSARSASALRAMTLSGSRAITRANASRAFGLSPIPMCTRPRTTRAET
jgi:hypothetical protein